MKWFEWNFVRILGNDIDVLNFDVHWNLDIVGIYCIVYQRMKTYGWLYCSQDVSCLHGT